jgi:hypothetical protein
LGPCAEWNAMNKVPSRVPSTIATAVHAKLRPRLMPMGPVAKLTSSALPTNQTAPRCHALPWRSLRGT